MRQALHTFSKEVIAICEHMEQAKYEDEFIPRLLNASYRYIRNFKSLPMDDELPPVSAAAAARR